VVPTAADETGKSPPSDGPATPTKREPDEMSFFVTSEGSPTGGNLGGLKGADEKCQRLATAVGAGHRVWKAYLSTSRQLGGWRCVENAKDRIGKGPWFSQKKQMIATDVATLHSKGILPGLIVTEKGERVSEDTSRVIVGTRADGTCYELRNCYAWTSSEPVSSPRKPEEREGNYARLGLANGSAAMDWVDKQGGHCSPEHLKASSSSIGRIYCFASD
jgi:hypothetical protein